MARRVPQNITDDLISASARHTIDLLRVSAAQRNDVLKLLDRLESDIIARIDAYAGKSQLTIRRLQSLLREVQGIIKSAYDSILLQRHGDLQDVAKASSANVVTAVNTEIGAKLLVNEIKASKVADIASSMILGRPAHEWWDKQAAKLADDFTVQMRLGMLQGEGVSELAKRVRGTKAAGYTDGIMNASRAQAEALVRTATIDTANTARLASFVDNADLIAGIQWVSTLDNRTSQICIALDGLQWKLPESGDAEDYGGYEPIDHDKAFPGPTAHWNCRSVQVSVLKPFDEIIGGKKIPADKRDKLDGKGGERISYRDWLDSRTQEEQNEILGARAAALYRSGKLELSDITNQNNRPLTAATLAERYDT